MARTELGDKKVQGQDYAYTILGWIKGVNSEILAGTNDIGKDGVDDASTTGSYKPSTPDIHAQVANDVFGYSLGYFSGDYSPINSSISSASLFTASTASASYLSTYGPNLYNGNISHMVTTITDPATLTVMPQLTAYRYDQLNRVKNMRAYRDISSNAWGSGSTYNSIYETKIAYDPNGNITGMYRNGNLTASLLMDSLSYKYNANTNKLKYVRDRMNNSTAHSSSYTNDIDDQSTSNYDYDEIGNLIKDAQEYINPASSPSGIEWNVYGKITKVTRTTNAACQLPDLEFTYDAAGNRIMKLKKPRVNGVLQASSTWEYTYYVREAQGNVLATYKRPGNNNSTIWLDNQYMYGSSRLGMVMRNVDITSASAPSTPYYRTIGEKYFELSNHLGNVLSTVTDRKKANDIYTFTNVGAGSGSYTYNSTFNSYLFVGAGNGSYNRSSGTDGWSDYYTADIKSIADYGVWGDELDGRTASSNSYRYGFNGKERDDEMAGVSGSSYDYGFRIYNPRIGKFLSVDPLTKSYPFYTPYQFAGNKPVQCIDLDGLEELPAQTTKPASEKSDGTMTTPVDNTIAGPSGEYRIQRHHNLAELSKKNEKVYALSPEMQQYFQYVNQVRAQDAQMNQYNEFEQQGITSPVNKAIAWGGLTALPTAAVGDLLAPSTRAGQFMLNGTLNMGADYLGQGIMNGGFGDEKIDKFDLAISFVFHKPTYSHLLFGSALSASVDYVGNGKFTGIGFGYMGIGMNKYNYQTAYDFGSSLLLGYASMKIGSIADQLRLDYLPRPRPLLQYGHPFLFSTLSGAAQTGVGNILFSSPSGAPAFPYDAAKKIRESVGNKK